MNVVHLSQTQAKKKMTIIFGLQMRRAVEMETEVGTEMEMEEKRSVYNYHLIDEILPLISRQFNGQLATSLNETRRSI